jgi:hypothetical protein
MYCFAAAERRDDSTASVLARVHSLAGCIVKLGSQRQANISLSDAGEQVLLRLFEVLDDLVQRPPGH